MGFKNIRNKQKQIEYKQTDFCSSFFNIKDLENLTTDAQFLGRRYLSFILKVEIITGITILICFYKLNLCGKFTSRTHLRKVEVNMMTEAASLL
jgi:hypothetical protein